MTLNFMCLYQDNLTTALYFISTIPQILGAMLALLGVFVVLRLESLKREIFSVSQEIIDKQNFKDLKSKIANGLEDTTSSIKEEIENLRRNQISGNIVGLSHNARELIRLMQSESSLISNVPIIKWLEIRCKRIQKGRKKFETFRKVTKEIFMLNGILLALFLISFLFIQKLTQPLWLFRITLFVGLCISGLALITMINFILHSVSNRIQKGIFDIRWQKKLKKKSV